mgnify:CR=1 FL=1
MRKKAETCLKYQYYNNTGLKISPVGLGTLTLGPFQLNLPVNEGAEIIASAVRRGINLIDTAKVYKTYPYVKRALEILSTREKENLHVIARSYDYSYKGMQISFNEALREMNLGRISIFMLHEMQSAQTIRGHSDAIKYLLQMKKEGKLLATGISSHYISAVRAAADHPEIDVIFAILNIKGIGIIDGTREEMEEALLEAHNNGKVILVMKALGGGHLYGNPEAALSYVKNLPFPCSTIIGMQNITEIEYNVSFFSEGDKIRKPPAPLKNKKKLFIEPWCSGCGACVTACPFGALSIINGKVVPGEACVLCSYCAGSCPGFNIKVV